MRAPVKRLKSIALGKMCNPSRGRTKHLKGPFSTEKDRKVSIGYQNSRLCVPFLNLCVNAKPVLEA